ncbi:SHOCT domain-containing protein [Methanosphaera sp. ISO3-F5]|uniref:SHOCT domain-containing protein n=1 Tax=Methanosphaera sp. ISO3-F5 TaxID=1452353 RepID=UPI002B258DAE|nr:SHOCT domain-containing protein [Methanosphaera sp. ISO3-F5]WQH63717.1 SHOCT domain-containing protein [Methanosphaera sp. ISO3-F5]
MTLNKINEVNTHTKKVDVPRLNSAKIKDVGNVSLELSENKFKIRSLDSMFNYNKPVQDIDFLLFSKGNFLLKDKFYIGIAGDQFEVNCLENEIEFKNFYESIKRMRNNTRKDEKLLNKTPSYTDTSINYNNTPLIQETEEKEEKINISEEIRNFHNLMKEGIISEEEFEEKKKELLKMKIE